MKFFADESCGQCTPCRVGTAKALGLMAERRWDGALLEELSVAMADASICGLGQAAPNPIRCVMKYFPRRSEYMTAMTKDELEAMPVEFKLNGKDVVALRRRDDHPDRQAPRRRDPAPLLQGRHAARRQLPRVHGRDQRRARARRLVLPPAGARAWK